MKHPTVGDKVFKLNEVSKKWDFVGVITKFCEVASYLFEYVPTGNKPWKKIVARYDVSGGDLYWIE